MPSRILAAPLWRRDTTASLTVNKTQYPTCPRNRTSKTKDPPGVFTRKGHLFKVGDGDRRWSQTREKKGLWLASRVQSRLTKRAG